MYNKAKDHAIKYLGADHVFTKKMEGILSDSAVKIKGVIERQNKRLSNKYSAPHSKQVANSGNISARSKNNSKDETELDQIIESANDISTMIKPAVGKHPRMNRSPPAQIKQGVSVKVKFP